MRRTNAYRSRCQYRYSTKETSESKIENQTIRRRDIILEKGVMIFQFLNRDIPRDEPKNGRYIDRIRDVRCLDR